MDGTGFRGKVRRPEAHMSGAGSVESWVSSSYRALGLNCRGLYVGVLHWDCWLELAAYDDAGVFCLAFFCLLVARCRVLFGKYREYRKDPVLLL